MISLNITCCARCGEDLNESTQYDVLLQDFVYGEGGCYLRAGVPDRGKRVALRWYADYKATYHRHAVGLICADHLSSYIRTVPGNTYTPVFAKLSGYKTMVEGDLPFLNPTAHQLAQRILKISSNQGEP